MKLCKVCNGIGSVPVSKAKSGNMKRCSECGGTGVVKAKAEKLKAENLKTEKDGE